MDPAHPRALTPAPLCAPGREWRWGLPVPTPRSLEWLSLVPSSFAPGLETPRVTLSPLTLRVRARCGTMPGAATTTGPILARLFFQGMRWRPVAP